MKVGFYETEITNPLGTCLTGYFHRRPMSGVKEKLFAKAVAIENEGEQFAILSVDTCSMTDDMMELIYERIEHFTGLTRKNILLNCTHSHTGALLRTHNRIVLEEEHADCEYRAKLCADTVVLALQRLQEATCRYGLGKQEKYIFIRNFLMKDGSYFTNPFPFDPNIDHPIGEIDPSVNVLYFEDMDGNPLGALTNYACHCDCVGGTEGSSDFPSILSTDLKKEYGMNFVSVYLQGACGNINHLDTQSEVDYKVRYKELGHVLADEVKRVIADSTPLTETDLAFGYEKVELERRKVPQAMLDDAEEKLRTIPEPESDECNIAVPDDPVMIRNYARNLLALYGKEAVEKEPVVITSVQAFRFGDCYFYGVPGELFNQYAFYIKENSPGKRNFISELSQPGCGGYLPIPELMESDNCYEGKYTSCRVVPGAGQILAEAAVKLAKTL
ncbi:MAG: neutral/alkaline non-lysosomal ceramidase N-terminal domain-containing protein [Clostridia bacterium]|nr:neutral/alkaline non-lysosomal ceramidase N-terminal domain-containing protein [Clostridia bacterium]